MYHARRLADATERNCAIDVLNASKAFLIKQPPGKVGQLERMKIRLPNSMDLVVSPVWVRHLDTDRLMILHLWESALSNWQLSAAGAILLSALRQHKPECASLKLDFISIAVPPHRDKRQLQVYSWESLQPLDDVGLFRFFQRLCAGWKEYRRRGPRPIKKRAQPDLFP
jgi:hypothetical protein